MHREGAHILLIEAEYALWKERRKRKIVTALLIAALLTLAFATLKGW